MMNKNSKSSYFVEIQNSFPHKMGFSFAPVLGQLRGEIRCFWVINWMTAKNNYLVWTVIDQVYKVFNVCEIGFGSILCR